MVTSAIKTFTQKVAWKDLDFIIVDMPPGTGDTQLTFSQEIKMDGVIIISTPQKLRNPSSPEGNAHLLRLSRPRFLPVNLFQHHDH